jgi:hypothetical protein
MDASINPAAVARFQGYHYIMGGSALAWREIFMAQDTADEKRNFTVRESSGEETGVFSGQTPRQAAMKVARRLEPAQSEQEATPERIVLREKGTKKLHYYDGWAWEGDAPADKPDWMGERITKANVSKEGIAYVGEI